MLRSCFLSSFVEFYSAVSEEKLKMSQKIIGQGGHFVFSDPPEKQILFSGFRRKVENVSENHRPGRPFCFFSIHLKNTNLVGGVEILLPIKFRRIPFTVSEEKSKMSQPIRGQGGNIFFSPICLKNTNVVEGIESLLPVKFCWIPFSGFYREVENVSANQRPGRPFCFSDRPKNTNLVEGVEILLPIKFHWIRFSGFRREVENVLANQRPGRPSCFSDRPEKHKLGRGR